ncbi:MAG: IS91 family transposase [Flavobacteriaceae bacterium]|nr:IS91 family transposase [Flavobacteriaceae bacterium]
MGGSCLPITMGSDVQVADILASFSPKVKTNLRQEKVIRDITRCKKDLGFHTYLCHDCDHKYLAYNSCRNRCCNQCGSLAQARWIRKKEEDLLDVSYFHGVFTLPEELNQLIRSNQKLLYDLMFLVVKESLMQAAARKSNLGAKIGFVSTLHTWGQLLNYHPHIHCIIPGGGLSLDGSSWVSCKKNYFLSVDILSTLMKAKFLDYLNKYYKRNLFTMGQKTQVENDQSFDELISLLREKRFVVFLKPSGVPPKKVIGYLGNYIHKVAISNSRLLSMTEDTVTFNYKNYEQNKRSIATLSGVEFVRRFLMHILPKCFVKTRSYGFLSNTNRKELVQTIRVLLKTEVIETSSNYDDLEAHEKLSADLFEFFGMNIANCPKCKSKNYVKIKNGIARSPPILKSILN